MSGVTLLGFLAGTLTTISFLPQFLKAWRTKSTSDLSLPMWLVLCTGVVLWLLYGILTFDLPLIVANAVALFITSSILVLKIRHG